MKHPLVTVLLSVYNGQKYLSTAIDSILHQTYTNLEFLIINDGSTDKTDATIRAYQDPRIRYIQNRKNKGLDACLNHGFKLARGKYIARMDADDISLPTRIEKQVAFLEANPDYGAIGTYYANMDAKGTIYEVGAQVIEDEDIKLAINSLNTFCHGSMMLRASVIKKYNVQYDHAYYPVDDYELWTRIVHLTKVRNLPEVLYLYMINPTGMMLTMKDLTADKPQKLNEKLQRTMPLPDLSWPLLTRSVRNASRYRQRFMDVQGKLMASNMMLAYQTHLYKLGTVYAKRKRLTSLWFFFLSFILSPINWGNKLFSRFSV